MIEKNNFMTAAPAAFGDVILLSSARSSFDQFQDHNRREGVYLQAGTRLANATGSGRSRQHHNRQVSRTCRTEELLLLKNEFSNLLRGFLRKNPGATNPQPDLIERTLTSAIEEL